MGWVCIYVQVGIDPRVRGSNYRASERCVVVHPLGNSKTDALPTPLHALCLTEQRNHSVKLQGEVHT